MEIVWDGPKRLANIAKHGMDFADLDLAFFTASVVVPAKSGRLISIADMNGATTVVFATLGSEALPIISMHPASIKESNFL